MPREAVTFGLFGRRRHAGDILYWLLPPGSNTGIPFSACRHKAPVRCLAVRWDATSFGLPDTTIRPPSSPAPKATSTIQSLTAGPACWAAPTKRSRRDPPRTGPFGSRHDHRGISAADGQHRGRTRTDRAHGTPARAAALTRTSGDRSALLSSRISRNSSTRSNGLSCPLLA
jgi:hypothetical protein